MNLNLDLLAQMQHSALRNYIVPGLSSHLLGGDASHGKVRLFRAEREQTVGISPHSHRFDFQCIVLRGSVTNTVWTQATGPGTAGTPNEMMALSKLVYRGAPGEYTVQPLEQPQYFSKRSQTYTAPTEGQCSYGLPRDSPFYSMRAEDIHSITFSRDAAVLFLEGPAKTHVTTVLEPFVNGARVPLFKIEPWMFQREGAAQT